MNAPWPASFLAFTLGFVFLASGSAQAQSSSLTGTELWSVAAEPGAGFGRIAALGDVNGDGFHDFAVGTGGEVVVFSGRNTAPLYSIAPPLQAEAWGGDLVATPDIDGEGIADLLVGDRDFDAPGGREHGKVHLYSGVDGRHLFGIEGRREYDHLKPRWAGDYDGDGVADLYLSADENHPGNQNDGPGYYAVVSGTDGAALRLYDGYVLQRHAHEMVPIEDLNGDGVPDFLLGIAGDSSHGLEENGAVRALSGVDLSAIWTTVGSSDFEYLGRSFSALDDLTGDGIADLIATAWPSPRRRLALLSGADGHEFASYQEGRGDGNFGGRHGSIGDVNGDGVSDFFVGGSSSRFGGRGGRLAVHSGADASRLLEAFGSLHDGYFGFDVAPLGDLNLDGFADMVAAESSSVSPMGNLRFFAGGSAPDAGWPGRVLGFANFPAEQVKVADVNGDGGLDLIARSTAAGLVFGFRNEGGFWPDWTAFLVSAALNDSSDVQPVDLDGDGDTDLIVAEAGGGRVLWIENDGTSPPAWTLRVIYAGGDAVGDVHFGDFDLDGDLDVVAALESGPTASWFENDGATPPGWTQHTISAAYPAAKWVGAGQLRAGGGVDVVVAYGGPTNRLVVWENDGANPPSWTERSVGGLSEGGSALHVANVDGDVDDDILIARLDPNQGPNSSDARWYGVPGAAGGWPRNSVGGPFVEGRRVLAADLDQSGWPDVLVAAQGSGEVIWYRDVAGPLEARRARPIVQVDGLSNLAIGDLTGNGVLDLVTTSADDGLVRVHRGRFFAPHVQQLDSGAPDEVNTLTITRAFPSASLVAAWSLTTGSRRAPGCPAEVRTELGTLRPVGPGVLPTDATGTAAFTGNVPAAASGKTVYFQAVDLTSCEVGPLRAHRFP